MEFQKVIESRRSIRKYDAEKKVSEEQIREMIQAAIYAPVMEEQPDSKILLCTFSGYV